MNTSQFKIFPVKLNIVDELEPCPNSDDETTISLKPEDSLAQKQLRSSIVTANRHASEIERHKNMFRCRIDPEYCTTLYPPVLDWKELSIFTPPTEVLLNENERNEGGLRKGQTDNDNFKMEGGVFQTSSGATRERKSHESLINIYELEQQYSKEYKLLRLQQATELQLLLAEQIRERFSKFNFWSVYRNFRWTNELPQKVLSKTNESNRIFSLTGWCRTSEACDFLKEELPRILLYKNRARLDLASLALKERKMFEVILFMVSSDKFNQEMEAFCKHLHEIDRAASVITTNGHTLYLVPGTRVKLTGYIQENLQRKIMSRKKVLIGILKFLNPKSTYFQDKNIYAKALETEHWRILPAVPWSSCR